MLETVSKSDIKNAVLDIEEKKFNSKFNFLKATNGIRPSALSFLLGKSGGGKSTLFKAIIADVSKNSEVIIWLSEEEKSFYSIDLFKADPEVNFKNIKFFQEVTNRKKLLDMVAMLGVADTFKEITNGMSDGIVFFDNLTTSCLYDGKKPEAQASILAELRDYAVNENIALFCAAHTQKNVNNGLNRLMEQEDIQGSSASTKTAAYFYILQLIDVLNTRQAFVMVSKHRGFNPENKFYSLNFSNGSYVSDRAVGFEVVNETWKRRNRLTDKEIKNGK